MTSTGALTGAWNAKETSQKYPMRSPLEKIVSDVRFAAGNRYPQLLLDILEQTPAENENDSRFRIFYEVLSKLQFEAVLRL
jgi:hypothetical protein